MVDIRLLMTDDPPFDATAPSNDFVEPTRRSPASVNSARNDHRLDEIVAGSLSLMLCGFGFFDAIAGRND